MLKSKVLASVSCISSSNSQWIKKIGQKLGVAQPHMLFFQRRHRKEEKKQAHRRGMISGPPTMIYLFHIQILL